MDVASASCCPTAPLRSRRSLPEHSPTHRRTCDAQVWILACNTWNPGTLGTILVEACDRLPMGALAASSTQLIDKACAWQSFALYETLSDLDCVAPGAFRITCTVLGHQTLNPKPNKERCSGLKMHLPDPPGAAWPPGDRQACCLLASGAGAHAASGPRANGCCSRSSRSPRSSARGARAPFLPALVRQVTRWVKHETIP